MLETLTYGPDTAVRLANPWSIGHRGLLPEDEVAICGEPLTGVTSTVVACHVHRIGLCRVCYPSQPGGGWHP